MIADNPSTIPFAQFDFLLGGIETQYAVAMEAAKGLAAFGAAARDIARQRRMNQMVENAIIQLEELSNVTVACSREERINRIPVPPRPDRQQTLLNYQNGR